MRARRPKSVPRAPPDDGRSRVPAQSGGRTCWGRPKLRSAPSEGRTNSGGPFGHNFAEKQGATFSSGSLIMEATTIAIAPKGCPKEQRRKGLLGAADSCSGGPKVAHFCRSMVAASNSAQSRPLEWAALSPRGPTRPPELRRAPTSRRLPQSSLAPNLWLSTRSFLQPLAAHTVPRVPADFPASGRVFPARGAPPPASVRARRGPRATRSRLARQTHRQTDGRTHELD